MEINAVKQPTKVILNTSQLCWLLGTFVQQEGTLRAICWSHSTCRREAAKEEAEWLLALRRPESGWGRNGGRSSLSPSTSCFPSLVRPDSWRSSTFRRRVWCPSSCALLLPRRDAPRDRDRRCDPPIPFG